MERNRWEYLKQLAPQSRYFHVSCYAAMRGDPRGVGYPAIPWIERPGITYVRANPKSRRQP